MAQPFTLLLTESAPGKLTVPGARMVVQRGPDRGRSQELTSDELLVGTSKSSSFVLTDPTVSRNHATVRVTPRGYLLTDLESTNGTRLEGRRIVAAYIEPGDRLELGATRLRFEPTRTPFDLAVSQSHSFGRLIGRTVAARRLFALLEAVAKEDVSVLLSGETGTGKDLAAEAIHEKSRRAAGPFMVVDCASLPANLIQSELFGHEAGAFSGAVKRRIGLLEAAQGGTLFLDEVGDLPRDLQPKLLGALERRTIQRVGGHEPIPLDVRIIAATHRDLKLAVNAGTFREDLYYRLNVVQIRVPPLRERREDIPLLAELFRRELTSDPHGALDPELVQALVVDEWPGNVRELRNRVERSLVAPERALPSDGDDAPPTAPPSSYRGAKELAVRAFESSFLRSLLGRAKGNQSEAARLAGMDRVHLIKLLRRHGL